MAQNSILVAQERMAAGDTGERIRVHAINLRYGDAALTAAGEALIDTSPGGRVGRPDEGTTEAEVRAELAHEVTREGYDAGQLQAMRQWLAADTVYPARNRAGKWYA
jgi:hypothetical protein